MVDRINLILKAKNITARQFAEEIGIQPSGMSHILSGRNNPSLDFVMKVIRRFPEIDINWLMFGKGEMYESSHISHQSPKQESVQEMSVKQESRTVIEKNIVGNNASNNVSQEQAIPDLFSSLTQNNEYSDTKEVDKGSAVVRQDVNKMTEKPYSSNATVPQTVVSLGDDSIANRVKKENMSTGVQLDENRVNDTRQGSVRVDENLGRKRIVKVVILYDDHSFSEYYPE